MASAIQSVYPVQNLQQALTAVEAATLLCLAKPKKEAVHALRTSVRRAEAQLELLTLSSGVPVHRRQANDAGRLLKKLRRAAGQVRDLDVQRKLVKQEEPEAGAHGGHAEAQHLRHYLKQQRRREAKRLLRRLHKQQSQLPLVLQSLLDALEPAESLTLNQTKLVWLVRRWYEEGTPIELDLKDADQLHRVRKRAKLARYLAESAPSTARTARRLAARFNALQEAGGTWHDWLLLSQIAEEELGRSAILPKHYRHLANQALHTYQARCRSAIR